MNYFWGLINQPLKTLIRKHNDFMGYLYKLLIILLFIILLPATSYNILFSQQQSKDQQLDQYLSEYRINKNVASISAGVLHKGKITWLNAKGYADLSHQIPATPKTIYRIASISKVITAVAVMQLWEKGKINLDADAIRYIPYFPKKKWKFTVRQILQHTAGLRSYKPGEFNSTVFFPTTRDAVNVISDDPLLYKPGTKFLYTTLGYNLLAGIIENASGMKFVDYLRKYIFEPAEMNSTYAEYQREIIPNKAVGYDKDKYRKIENAPLADLSIKFAGGGLVSTPHDILKFAHCLLNNKLINHSTLDSMLIQTRLSNGRIMESGLGFDIKTDTYGKKFFGHYGFGTGFISLLAIYPKDTTAVVDFINTDDRNLGSPALDLASIVLENKRSVPPKPLSDQMMNITLSKNLDSAIAECAIIKRDTSNRIDMSSSEFNLFGYDLLSIKRNYDAIRWFNFFTTQFPKNISAYIGLGDSYYHDNNKGKAFQFYRRALLIDSTNSYALRMIKKIQSE